MGFVTVNAGVEGLPDLIKSVATAVGLRDPINVYEPGLTLQQVWEKYAPRIDMERADIAAIPNGAAQKSLLASWNPLNDIRNSLGRYFAPGGTPGTKQRDKLGEMVQGSRNLDRDIRAARKKYGVVQPAVIDKADAAVAARAGGGGFGSLVPLLLIGGGLFVVGKSFKLF